MKILRQISIILSLIIIHTLSFYSCSNEKEAKVTLNILPEIFPDYTNITIPPNIAPLNFMIENTDEVLVEFHLEGTNAFSIKGNKGLIKIPNKQWRGLLNKAIGKTIQVHVSIWNSTYPEGAHFLPFAIQVVTPSIDEWIAYRLIEPGYQSWKQLGIYQRNITSFEEKEIITNQSSTQTCLNCHSFHNYSPQKMMFHARGQNGGTYILNNGEISKVNIEKIGLKKGASYPIWHPNGKLIAFSSNTTQQAFFEHGEQPLEVYDERSDLIFYDIENNETFSDPRFMTSKSMETFPAWSPDGNFLYFASAESKSMPQGYKDMYYHLLKVSFDPQTRVFGSEIDTVYHAKINNGSASYPRISPNGKYLLYTQASCGTFPIWHKDADLQMLDLSNYSCIDISIWNSEEADSYHSWSSNGHWIVFGSRRDDGRYTRLYLAYWDNGKAYKPFLLPQENPMHNIWRAKSYNIPEFMNESIELSSTNFSSLKK